MNESALLERPAINLSQTGVPLADLVLVRLLTEKKSLSPAKLREGLTPFFRKPPSPEQFAAAVTELRANGFLTAKGQMATPAGCARALQFLGQVALPAGSNWRSLKAKYLIPRALGLPAETQETLNTTAKTEKLAAFLLKRKLALPVGTGSTLKATLEAIVCRELGYPEHATLKALIPLLLAKVVRSDSPLSVKEAESVVPRVLLNAKRGGLAGLHEIILAGWSDQHEPQAARDVDDPFDHEAFAHTVLAVVRECPTGRFGGNKVFINHVWKQLRDEPRFVSLGLDGFKAKLVEANRADLLTLSRADLVQLMDPNDVRESETTHLNAVYHFILVERN